MIHRVRLADELCIRDSYDVDDGKLLIFVTLWTGHEV